MARAKKANTRTPMPTQRKANQINVSLSDRTRAALEQMAKDTRRPVSSMARILLEDATGTAPE